MIVVSSPMFVVNDIHVTVEVNNVTVHLLITLIVVSCLVFVVNDIHVTVEVNDVTMLFYLQNFELSSANDENHLR